MVGRGIKFWVEEQLKRLISDPFQLDFTIVYRNTWLGKTIIIFINKQIC